jgi:hypothetical protein
VKRLVAVLALLAATAGCGPASAEPAGHSSPGSTGKEITAELAKVRVVPSRPEVPGYKRAEFGQAWTDDHNGKGGHNGCDTRDDVLTAQLTATAYRGTKHCVVISGRLADPYTGRTIEFRKAQATAVQIDHVYPLGRAWDMGAAKWTKQRRVDYANDQAANLLAVDGRANASKGDSGPGEWLPINKAYRCTYVLRYLQVADKYRLPITKDDADAARTILPTCGGAR